MPFHENGPVQAWYEEAGSGFPLMIRDFVRSCLTPVLVMPNDVPAHPFATAMETAELAPNSQVSPFPWTQSRSPYPGGGPPHPVLPEGAPSNECMILRTSRPRCFHQAPSIGVPLTTR